MHLIGSEGTPFLVCIAGYLTLHFSIIPSLTLGGRDSRFLLDLLIVICVILILLLIVAVVLVFGLKHSLKRAKRARKSGSFGFENLLLEQDQHNHETLKCTFTNYA